MQSTGGGGGSDYISTNGDVKGCPSFYEATAETTSPQWNPSHKNHPNKIIPLHRCWLHPCNLIPGKTKTVQMGRTNLLVNIQAISWHRRWLAICYWNTRQHPKHLSAINTRKPVSWTLWQQHVCCPFLSGNLRSTQSGACLWGVRIWLCICVWIYMRSCEEFACWVHWYIRECVTEGWLSCCIVMSLCLSVWQLLWQPLLATWSSHTQENTSVCVQITSSVQSATACANTTQQNWTQTPELCCFGSR